MGRKKMAAKDSIYRYIGGGDGHGVLKATEGKAFEELAPACVKAMCENLEYAHQTGMVLGATAIEMLLSGMRDGAAAAKRANLEKIPSDLVPLKMVCERTGLTKRHLSKLAQRGALTIIKTGKYGCLPRSEYDALILGKVR